MKSLLKWIFLFIGIFVVSSSTLLAINESRAANSTICTNQGTQSSSNLNKFHQSQATRNWNIKDFFIDGQRNLWIATQKNGVWERRSQTTKFIKNNGMSNNKVNQIFQDIAGNLWAGTEMNGLWEQNSGTTVFKQNKHLPDKSWISQIVEDNNQNLWVCTSANGLWEQQSGAKVFRQNKDLPKDVEIQQIFEDHNNNLWLGTDSGLWEQTAINKNFNLNTRLPRSFVVSIFQDQQGNLWVGTDGYKLSDNGLWETNDNGETFTQIKQLKKYYVKHLLQDKDGNIWAGTNKAGLWVLANGSSSFQQIQSLKRFVITHLFEDQDNNLWVGTSHNGLWDESRGQKTFMQNVDFKNYYVGKIWEDVDGDLWVGTLANGLWEKDNSGIYIVTTPNTASYNGSETICGGLERVSFYQKPFAVAINNVDILDVSRIEINNVEQDLNLRNAPINFPNIKFDIKTNQTFLVHIDFRSGTTGVKIRPSYNNYFCIKSSYLDNGRGGSDDLNQALETSGGRSQANALIHTTKYLKNDHTKSAYELYYDLDRSNAIYPTLIVKTQLFNFLTNQLKSTWEPIRIKNGTIIKDKETSLNKKTYTIPGSNKNNLYEFNLVDYVGNKYSFLLQEGGASLNNNFSGTPYENHVWENIKNGVLITAAILLAILLVCALIWQAFNRFNQRKNNSKKLSKAVISRRISKNITHTKKQ